MSAMNSHILGLTAFAALCAAPLSSAAADTENTALSPKSADCVVLLHGLARTSKSMTVIEKDLTQAGYFVVNLGYPSREDTIEALAQRAIKPALEACGEDRYINFVTHSLGGILVRQYQSQAPIPRLRRVVMLGPPNQGSPIPDKLGRVPGFDYLNGPAGAQLGMSGLPAKLGPADFDLGIIAGNRTINVVLSQLIPDADDGKVSVEGTKLDGMSAHIVLPVSHALMMRDKTVIAHIEHYLDKGEFITEDTALATTPLPQGFFSKLKLRLPD